MAAQLFWVETPVGRRLAILARPSGGDRLCEELRSWRKEGIDVVVSLLTELELREFDLVDESAACSAEGMEFISVPIPDRGVPESTENFAQLVARLSRSMSAGKSVGMHCRASVGRSAVLAASLLIATGVSSKDAFERVRAARGAPVPDSAEQLTWVEQFARRLLVEAG